MIVCLSLGLETMIEKAPRKNKTQRERKQVNVKVDQAE